MYTQRAAGRFGSLPKGGETLEKEFIQSYNLCDNIFVIHVFFCRGGNLPPAVYVRVIFFTRAANCRPYNNNNIISQLHKIVNSQ